MSEHRYRLPLDLYEDSINPAGGIAPGKRTLTQSLPAVQRREADAPIVSAGAEGAAAPAPPAHEDPFGMHLLGTAARGVEGGGGALPHLDVIQASFGPHHDVSHVRAHVGGDAARASEAIGAEAYATGDRVAFRRDPDLHTAAHEAAHVVQQRGGVHLKGGVGEAGDAYERHADAVADKVVAGESAAALLDELAGGGGGGAHRAVQGAGMFGNLVPPELKFKSASHAERKRMLRGERDRQTQVAWLRGLAPHEATALLLGEDAIELPAAHVHALVEQLPRVIAALSPREATSLLTLRPEAAANARLFARLPFATQLATWRELSPPERRAEVWPTGGSVELKTALLASLAEHLVQVLVVGLSSAQVQDIVDYLPAHAVGRVRSACQMRGVHLAVVGQASRGEGDGGGDGGGDVDARADQLEIEHEEWDAANRKPKRAGRPVSSDVPEPDAWAELPWMFRVQYFAVAPGARRVAYLARERERKAELLATLDDARDRGETLARYVAKYPWAADRILGHVEAADLVAAMRALDDATDVARVFIACVRYPQRVPLLLAVMSPLELAAAFRVAEEKQLPALWAAVEGAAPAATVTSALRRLSDDELERVERWSNDPDGVARLSPPERRQAPSS